MEGNAAASIRERPFNSEKDAQECVIDDRIKKLSGVEIRGLQSVFGEEWRSNAEFRQSLLHDKQCTCACCHLRAASREAMETVEVSSSPSDSQLLGAAEFADEAMSASLHNSPAPKTARQNEDESFIVQARRRLAKLEESAKQNREVAKRE
eukprot:2310519-Karenia_brevis.AAC.1